MEGLKCFPALALWVQAPGGLQAMAQGSYKLIEGVKWVFVYLCGCVGGMLIFWGLPPVV